MFSPKVIIVLNFIFWKTICPRKLKTNWTICIISYLREIFAIWNTLKTTQNGQTIVEWRLKKLQKLWTHTKKCWSQRDLRFGHVNVVCRLGATFDFLGQDVLKKQYFQPSLDTVFFLFYVFFDVYEIMWLLRKSNLSSQTV